MTAMNKCHAAQLKAVNNLTSNFQEHFMNKQHLITIALGSAFAAATLIYLLVNLCVVLAMRKLENHLRLPGFIGSASNAPQAGH